MLRLRRPSDAVIAAHLSRPDEPFSYPEVAATAELGSPLPASLAARYDVDHHRFSLGSGRPLFERARAGLVAWRHFDIPWLELHGATTRVEAGGVVATLVGLAGIWFLNPCRVVYTELPDPSNRVAFAYGTLRGHAECGEERFTLAFDPTSSEVSYEIAAFSRPAILVSRLAYPLARRLQRRFAAASARALLRAVTSDGG